MPCAGLGAMTAGLAEIQAVTHQLNNPAQVTSPLFALVSPGKVEMPNSNYL